MRIEMNFIVSLDDFQYGFDEWQLSLLHHYGIGQEDIFLIAMQHAIQHVVPVDENWFQQYLDTAAVVSLWLQMQGNRRATATQQGLIETYRRAVFTVYQLYFNFFHAVFRHFGVEPSLQNANGYLRVAQLKRPDPTNLAFILLFDEPSESISRI